MKLPPLIRWYHLELAILLACLSSGVARASCNDMAGATAWTHNCSGTIWCESAGCFSCPSCNVDCRCDWSTCWCDSWYISIDVCWTWSCGGGQAKGLEQERGPFKDPLSDPLHLAGLGIDVPSNVRSDCFQSKRTTGMVEGGRS